MTCSFLSFLGSLIWRCLYDIPTYGFPTSIEIMDKENVVAMCNAANLHVAL